MKAFYNKNFLLQNASGKRLYHEVAARLPIIDPHNHLDPAILGGGEQFENLYKLWIERDPYKHRAMRILGIEENRITGDCPDYEKYLAWVECYANTAGSPLFHWCAMELKEVFGINLPLTIKNAEIIWDKANKKLEKNNFNAIGILKKLGVETLCTSDDLLDGLEHHVRIAVQEPGLTCLPSLRSDSILAFHTPGFSGWLERLMSITGIQIDSLSTYKQAIVRRLDFFDSAGCLLSDHSLDSGFSFEFVDDLKASDLFGSVLDHEGPAERDSLRLQSHMLHFLGKEYASRKWKMQLHIGAQRFTSTKLRQKLGPAGGYACIGNSLHVESLCSFLDGLDKENALPKTILYSLNPADNEVLCSLTGSFSEDGIQGKIQAGPAWWYNDHFDGIMQQLISLSNYGLLATSIGMTTDSRSILSFVRHMYYRRILCNLLGSWMEEGKLPSDFEYVSTLVENVSYFNIKKWLIK